MLPTNEIVSERKAILAKLLAQENITIEFRNVSTAFFDIKGRLLVLPNMKDGLSQELYNLFIGHEVGHALTTPIEYATKGDLKIPNSIPKGKRISYAQGIKNIIEDVRIERFIQSKYPGLRSDFITGYNELWEKGFFLTKEDKALLKKNPTLTKDDIIKDKGFLDRLNIHAKCGVRANIQFTPDEQNLVEKCVQTRSYKEVLVTCQEIINYVVTKEKNKNDDDPFLKSSKPRSKPDEEEPKEPTTPDDEKDPPPPFPMGLPSPVNNDVPIKPLEKDAEGKEGEGGGSQGSFDKNAPEPEKLKDLDATTDESMQDSFEQMLRETKNEIVTVNIPKFNLDNIIVDYKEFSSKIMVEMKRLPHLLNAPKYRKYKEDNASIIKYLVKEFELRKNAFQIQKEQIYKTGNLDPKKLAQYQTTVDIFRRNTIIPGGKSHGLVLFIDWSGSMKGCIDACIQQLFCITDFCRHQSIPFDVYAFQTGCKDGLDSYNGSLFQSTKAGDIDFHHFHLTNILSSRMSHTLYVATQKGIMEIKNCGDWVAIQNCDLGLGGTPLNNAIAAAMDIVPAFKKKNNLQVVNTIFLTDGASDQTQSFYNGSGNDRCGFYGGEKVYIRDNISKVIQKVGLVQNYRDHSYPSGGQYVTYELLQLLEARTQSNVIGFYLTSHSSGMLSKTFNDSRNTNNTSWIKDGYLMQYGVGYTMHYSIRTANLNIDNSNVGDLLYGVPKAEINKKVLEKAFLKSTSNKIKNRAMLTNFIQLIS